MVFVANTTQLSNRKHIAFYNCVVNSEVLVSPGADMTNFTVDPEEQLANCKAYERYWRDINPSCETNVLPSFEDVTHWFVKEKSGSHVQALVCGSLHLVGAAMATLHVTANNLYDS